jgi:FdhD protein
MLDLGSGIAHSPAMTDKSSCPLPSASAHRGIRKVNATYIAKPGDAGQVEQCQVVEEDTLFIDIEQLGNYTLMWTPTEVIDGGAGFTHSDGVLAELEYPAALSLAVGFAYTEGIINSLDDIATMAICPDEDNVVKMQLHNPDAVQTRRSNVVVTSSCGICGKRDLLDNNVLGLETVPDNMTLDFAAISHLMQLMKERQAIFQDTGGSHAAAIFSPDGELHAVAEDLGRHNAFDKVIGRTLMEHNSFNQRGALLSSRLSFEMVVKAIRAKLEIVAAVSAPTSLAIEMADRFGLTLCGFVRGERATVYTHPHRIKTS